MEQLHQKNCSYIVWTRMALEQTLKLYVMIAYAVKMVCTKKAVIDGKGSVCHPFGSLAF